MSGIKSTMYKYSTEKENVFEPFEINGYRIDKPLITKDSGSAKWGFCTKDCKEYFIKQFLSPVFPEDNDKISAGIKNKLFNECNVWFNNKKMLYKRINKAQNGNIIAPIEFFQYKGHFFIITNKVDVAKKIDFKNIYNFPFEVKKLLLLVLSSTFASLSSQNIIHADVKPENILFKETLHDFYTAKLIDFDAGYLKESPPKGDDIQLTESYIAPETFLAMIEEEAELTPKVDVFALGIIFHEILSGEKPSFNSEYSNLYEAVLNDSNIKYNKNIPSDYIEIIGNMLKKDPEERWSAAKVFNNLRKI